MEYCDDCLKEYRSIILNSTVDYPWAISEECVQRILIDLINNGKVNVFKTATAKTEYKGDEE